MSLKISVEELSCGWLTEVGGREFVLGGDVEFGNGRAVEAEVGVALESQVEGSSSV